MKKKTTEKPWRAGYWENEDFTFTEEQESRFLELIPNEEVRRTAGKVIQDLVRRELAYIHHIQLKPPDKTVLQQLTLLENQTNKLFLTLYSLHSPTIHVLDRWAVISVSKFREDLSTFRTTIMTAKKHRLLSREAKGGRPRNAAMRRLISELVIWWLTYIGMPDCYRDRTTELYEGDFYHFAVAVITPVLRRDRGLAAVIERIVAGYREMMEKAQRE